MKRRISRILAASLGLVLGLFLFGGEGAGIPVEAAQNEAAAYSEAGTMTIKSRRVSKAELYGNVPQEQKSVSINNPVAVEEGELSVEIREEEVLDYIRFAEESAEPAFRKANPGEEAIRFEAICEALAGVNDWTNLPIRIGDGEATTTATNFRGEGTKLIFTVPTKAGEARTLTIYAGGHPHTGTITASAKIGEEIIEVKAGEVSGSSYGFTPESSQIVEYSLKYVGNGEDLAVTLSLNGTKDMNWAGICAAAAVLKNDGIAEGGQGEEADIDEEPKPFVLDSSSLSNPDLNAWKLWYQDEFDTGMNDWWESSYLKWWNYSSEGNEAYNQVEYSEEAKSGVLRQFTTETMRADSIVTRRDNFRNPGITLGVRDLIHNYGAKNLTNYQHMATDDRGATAYGYFEIRAKITGGTNSKIQSGSSAWWFTGFQDASWQTVEVDMVEYGYGVAESNLNAHFSSPLHKWRDPFAWAYPSSWNSTDKNLGVAKPADDYHVYGFEWTPEGMNGYFDGVLVWSKKISVNYRMLMWLSLNSHAYDTYVTGEKEHFIDYVRVWKTAELEELEKQLVTKNIVQKQAVAEGNVATLAYAGANGIRSGHYQKYDPAYMNDGDVNTSYRAMTAAERGIDQYPQTPYNNGEHYLYLDWVEYTAAEVAEASLVQESITDKTGKQYTLASEQEIRTPKTVAAVELVVNRSAGTKAINKAASDNATGTFAYTVSNEAATRFPYRFTIEYSEDGYNGWTPLATDVTAEWKFDEKGTAAFVTNVTPVSGIHHIRLHVKSVWNTETNREESTDNGFYVAEIKVYEVAREGENSSVGEYRYNHAAYAKVWVTDKDGNAGSEDKNFPVGDVADGVYVNEFRSSGDGERLAENANRVDTTKLNVPVYPQYIHFQWPEAKTIDSLGLTIGYTSSAPTAFELQVKQTNGEWKTVLTKEEAWSKNFEKKNYEFPAETAAEMRVMVKAANQGPKLEYNGGIEGDGNRIVRIAGGYYSIAEIELNETK